MGFQALLFCPDEKNARVVTQVLTELDFSVEPVAEPFAAVKKLMAQHFDALVVDCENEQNASLLFRSARNSNSNQSSLAVAVVEGQAGVAKAFRIGANLVLTKPINLEQSKGTLRVARGLLRKGADPAKGSASTASAAEASLSTAAQRPRSSFVPPTPVPATPGVASGMNPALADQPDAVATVLKDTRPPAAGAGAEKSPWQLVGKSKTAPSLPLSQSEASAEKSLPAASNPPFMSTVSRGQSAGAAVAPARELPSSLLAASDAVSPTQATVPATGFSIFDTGDDERGASRSKKIIVIAIIVILIVTVAAYFGYRHGNNDQKPAVSTEPEVQNSSAPSNAAPGAPALTPKLKNEPAGISAGPQPPLRASTAATKPSPSMKTAEPIVEDTTVTIPQVAPMKVKSDVGRPAAAKAPQTEQPAPPAPALSIGNGDPNEKALSSIVTSAPVSVPQPAPEAPPQVLNISQGVTQGMVIKRVQPVYPPQALTMRVQGPVQLQATIGKDGNITHVKTISGDSMLSRAAMDAVRQWKYKPYYLNDEPVEIQTQITVVFKLPN
jgi:periplasmic protein TonB